MQNSTFGRGLGIGVGVCIASIALYSLGTSESSSDRMQQGEFLPLDQRIDANSPTPAVLGANQATQTAGAIEVGENRVRFSVIEELPDEDAGFHNLPSKKSDVQANSYNRSPQATESNDLWSLAVSEDANSVPRLAAPESVGTPLARPSAAAARIADTSSVSSMLPVDGPETENSVLSFEMESDSPHRNQLSNDSGSSAEPRRAHRLDSLSGSGQSLSDPYDIAPLNLGISDAVAQRAAHHVEYGKSLARRGAGFAARQEFYSALQVIAHANDEKIDSHAHTAALRSAIIAFKEAEDFVVTDAESQMGLRVSRVIETHRSGLLTQNEATNLTPVEAMQLYFRFAQEQFGLAGGRHVVSAEALFCLGKLHSVMQQHAPGSGRLETAKAIVYHRAALTNDATNYRSAGELGVLMARMGQLEDAKTLFKQSLRIQSTPQAWENLAKVHERLGETKLAQLAQSEQIKAYQSTVASSIEWKSADRFNLEAPTEFHDTIAGRTNEKVSPATFSEDSNESKSFTERLKARF